MARADVVSDIQSIASGANLDFQPAAGVEVMITEVGSGEWNIGYPNISVQLYNGTLASIVRLNAQGVDAAIYGKPLKLFINNTRYLRINNVASTTKNLSYCGVQTK